MKLILRLSALAMSGLSLGACATITRGTTTEFVVESTPPGALVNTSTGFRCPSTPCTFKMPRKDAFEVTVTKPGYTTATAHVGTEITGGGAAGLAGNIVAGGIIGIGVDAMSGAMNNLTPNPLRVVLEAKPSDPPVHPPTP